MSATLTWFHSGNGTKTGTAVGNLFADLVTLIQATDGGADFSWEYAGSNTGSTPYYVTLKRKDASAGRIFIGSWTSAPAGVQPVLFDSTPTLNQVFVSYFPAGNTDTASNLTAASGTIMGDDTGALKVTPCSTASAIYGTSYVPFYFDCYAGCVFGFANPASATTYPMFAGDLLVDFADNAYPMCGGGGTNATSALGSTTTPLWAWSATAFSAGNANPSIRTNYGSNNRFYFNAYMPSGSWANTSPSAGDILSDTGSSKRYYAPIHLLGQTKGEGIVLKLRQIAYGTGTTSAYEHYDTSGPVVKARQFSNTTAGATGVPWMTNFKL
jgi:hypothetical protein